MSANTSNASHKLSTAFVLSGSILLTACSNQSSITKPTEREITYMPAGGYEATVATHFVEPSSVKQLNAGDKIKALTQKNYAGETVLQRLTERSYWVQKGFYNTVFYVGDEGVLLLDPLAYGSGEAVLEAIKSVTDKPITAVIYSHHHEDHIGDIAVFVNSVQSANKPVRIIASQRTAEIMKQHGSKLLSANDIIAYPSGKTQFENLSIQLHGFENPAHAYDSAGWLLVEEGLLHAPDMLNPNQMPFLNFGGSETYNNYPENLQALNNLPWRYFSGGHGNIGSKADFTFMENYLMDLEKAIDSTMPKLNIDDFFVAKYNNHQASVAAYNKAFKEQVMAELRPKYGKLYGFEASVPYQIDMVLKARGH